MNKRGFTLLEVLAAMAILTIVLAIVYATFDAVTRTMEIGREEAELLRKQQFLLRALRTVENVYAGASEDDSRIIFEGEDGADSEGSADTLTFLAATPPRGGAALPGDLTQVRFAVTGPETDTEEDASTYEAVVGTGERALIISQVPLLTVPVSADADSVFDADKDDVEELEEVTDLPVLVDSVSIDYYDGSLEEWFDDWSYDELQRLPWAVRVRITFPRAEEDARAARQAGLDPEEDPDVEVFVTLAPGLGLFKDSLPVGALR